MIQGIYQSASGMASLMQRQEIIAHNLANMSTPGFKQEVFRVQQAAPARLAVDSRVDQSAGSLKMTEAPTHFALVGAGYFTVATPQGPVYTRNGEFHLDQQGRLVTAGGHAVQGQNGDMILPSSDFTVTEAGEIIVRGEAVDRLQVVRGEGAVRRLGQSFLRWETEDAVVPLEANQVQVMQGVLEGANVNVVKSMVQMLTVMRMYEANQKALESQDQTIQQVINQVGKVRS